MDTSPQQLMGNISYPPTDTSKHRAVHDMQDKECSWKSSMKLKWSTTYHTGVKNAKYICN